VPSSPPAFSAALRIASFKARVTLFFDPFCLPPAHIETGIPEVIGIPKAGDG
jgi:hypothetical protein